MDHLRLLWQTGETLQEPDSTTTDTMLEETARALRNSRLEAGRRVVITAGVTFRKSGPTNLIKVHTI